MEKKFSVFFYKGELQNKWDAYWKYGTIQIWQKTYFTLHLSILGCSKKKAGQYLKLNVCHAKKIAMTYSWACTKFYVILLTHDLPNQILIFATDFYNICFTLEHYLSFVNTPYSYS